MPAKLDAKAFEGNLRDYAVLTGRSFIARAEKLYEWVQARRRSGVWPYSKCAIRAPGAETSVRLEDGTEQHGANFASQDYLSLSSHQRIKAVACDVVREYGVHSAGSAALMGNTTFSSSLEGEVARFTHYEEALLFPTGWAAGFGAIRGLVRPHDHVLIDVFAHASLREGVHTATNNVRTFRHLDNQHAESILKEIRATDQDGAILVVTESLFSMDADTPDMRSLQALCREYGATLLVDCAHDLGALGPTGRGTLEDQDMVGKVDVLMGSFSKTFASNGGFVACNSRALIQMLKCFAGPQVFSNALSPVQAAVVTEAFRIVDSAEGHERRVRLMKNIVHLRAALAGAGLACIGAASPIVPVVFESVPLTRMISRAMLSRSAIVNFAEFPAVPANKPRVRLQVQTEHTAGQIEKLVRALHDARHAAEAALRENDLPLGFPERGVSKLRIG